MSSYLPSLLGSSALSGISSREVARLNRETDRQVALVNSRAYVVAERGHANARAIETVAIEAMHGVHAVTERGVLLANSCPAAEGAIRRVLDQASIGLADVVRDTARALR